MSMNKRNDLLDSLLFAAAKDAGTDDIGEYKNESAGGVLPDSLAEKICGTAVKNDDCRRVRKFGFRRFVAVAAAAAFLPLRVSQAENSARLLLLYPSRSIALCFHMISPAFVQMRI